MKISVHSGSPVNSELLYQKYISINYWCYTANEIITYYINRECTSDP